MDRRLHSSAMIIWATLSTACAIVLPGGCGGPKGSLDQLAVIQYRYNVDDAGSVVRVVGMVRNRGEERTPAADVVVTLVGRTGSMKGQNRVELPSLAGGAEHRFAVAVTAHGRVDDVEIEIVPRGDQLPDEGATAGEESGAPGGAAAGNAAADDRSHADAQEGE